jgi:ubiquinol-cytochrome c reductase cytochrome c subunit
MNGPVLVFAAFVTLSAAAAAQAPERPAAQAPKGDAGNGRKLYHEASCYYCHGTVGQGGLVAVGPRVALVPRSVESFIGYVRKPSGRMSAYSAAVLSDAELTDIYAYLRTLPAAKPAKEIPLLEQLRPRGPGGAEAPPYERR